MSERGQIAIGSAIAQAAGAGATATVIMGFCAAEVENWMRAASAEEHARIATLSTQLDTTEQAVRGFFSILGEENIPSDQLLPRLTLMAKRYRDIRERLESLTPEDSRAQEFLNSALLLLGRASSAAEYDEVDLLLCKAEEAQSCILQDVRALQRDAQDRTNRLLCDLAATRSERAQLRLQRFEYLQAADQFRAAIEILPDEAHAQSFSYRLGLADSWSAYGDEKWDSTYLLRAVYVYRELLKGFSVGDDPKSKAEVQLRLGDTLAKLPKEQFGVERIHEAVVVYREALQSLSNEQGSETQSHVKNSLALALQALFGAEAKTEFLQEAIGLHRQLLAVRSSEASPISWATTQNNLGYALRMLSEEREDKELLKEAIAHFRRALQVCTRSEEPLGWATMQFNLAIALHLLAHPEHNTDSLVGAVSACREALLVRERDRLPVLWALTQTRLAHVLRCLGESESSASRLRESVCVHQQALEVYTRNPHRRAWAQCQNGLGSALSSLGQVTNDSKALNDAIVSHCLALEEYTRDQFPREWANVQNSLGISLTRLAEREKSYDRAFEALVAFGLAWTIWDAKASSTTTAMMEVNFRWVLSVLETIRLQTTDCSRYLILRTALRLAKPLVRLNPALLQKVRSWVIAASNRKLSTWLSKSS